MARSWTRSYIRQYLLQEPYVAWASGDPDSWAHVAAITLAKLIPSDISAAVVQQRLAAVFGATTAIASERDPLTVLHERLGAAFSPPRRS